MWKLLVSRKKIFLKVIISLKQEGVEGQDGPATIEDSYPCKGWKPWTKARRLGQRLRSQGQVSDNKRDVAPGTDSV